MKFSEIPQFICNGNYEINVPLDYFEDNITRFKKDRFGLQLNPDFQRGHVWIEQQQIDFVEYFLRGGVSGRVIYFNKPSWQGDDKIGYDDFVCVDGLQRITALRKFLNGNLKVFGQYIEEFEERLRMLKAGNNLKFNINNLQTEKEVLEWYLQMNSGGTPHTEEELNRVKKMLEEKK